MRIRQKLALLNVLLTQEAALPIKPSVSFDQPIITIIAKQFILKNNQLSFMKLLNPKYAIATLAIICCLSTQKIKAQVNIQDSLALIDLYDSTGGPNWTNHTNWLTTAPVSTWYGITVKAGRVFWINLPTDGYPGNNLTGSIPASLGNLSQLNILQLDYNKLTGSIPVSLGNLTNLMWVNFLSNNLTGSIPASLGNLKNLTSLNLEENQLTDTIPSSLANLTKLTSLALDYNRLSGTIPSWLGGLINLTDLGLEGNKLTGTIPDSLGNLTKLTQIYLYDNQLTGSIPASFGNLTKLQWLLLDNNQLSGSIPASIGNITKLTDLNLSNNNLSGTIPASLGNLVNLTSLSLSNNNFTFDGMELIATKFPFAVYAPQAPIKIYNFDYGSSPSVSAGGTLSNNTYSWYFYSGLSMYSLDVTKVGDSTVNPISIDNRGPSLYYVVVTNSIANKLALYSDTVGLFPEPIKSINLQAKETNGKVLLQWQTINEINTASFTIQYSTNGISFSNINTKAAVGKGDNSYSLIDNSPTNGIHYYRLKSVDKDGSFSYSKVVSVHLTIDRLPLTVSPNPAKDIVTVRGTHIVSVQVVDNLGRAIKTFALKGATNPTLSVGSLPVGVYYLRIQTTDGKVNGVEMVKE